MMKTNTNNVFFFIEGESPQTIELNYSQHLLSELKQGYKGGKIQKQKINKLNSTKLITLFQELINFMNLGMTLNEAIYNIAISGNRKFSPTCLYLATHSSNGVPLEKALLQLCDKKHQFIGDLLPKNTTQENFRKSLTVILDNLISKKETSTQLTKSLYYPFFIIQASILSLIGNMLLEDTLELNIMMVYFLVSAVQIITIHQTTTGKAIYFLEYFSSSLRLYNFFELLSSSLDTGESLQDTIKKIADSTSHQHHKKQLYVTYYKLKLGLGYAESFPRYWFLGESYLALVNSSKNGNIERALLLASALQKQRWFYILSLLNRIVPALSLLTAGFFVAKVLINIYAPLMEPY
ncbi:type II secretion system F family protein [Marinomonas sp. 2405UD68-3]|uniref:type II secretion system F family protein n=1 Tax=Marinomonas sp. 2405UD68-3 TaxID=3391835 RepID=UPI0039C957F2